MVLAVEMVHLSVASVESRRRRVKSLHIATCHLSDESVKRVVAVFQDEILKFKVE